MRGSAGLHRDKLLEAYTATTGLNFQKMEYNSMMNVQYFSLKQSVWQYMLNIYEDTL